jgi:hypothetical protein
MKWETGFARIYTNVHRTTLGKKEFYLFPLEGLDMWELQNSDFSLFKKIVAKETDIAKKVAEEAIEDLFPLENAVLTLGRSE